MGLPALRAWIPAFAGMKSKIRMGSSLRWNDGEVWNRRRRVRAVRAWVPAFAGMTSKITMGSSFRWN